MCSKIPLYSVEKSFHTGDGWPVPWPFCLSMAKEKGSNQRLPWIFTLALGTFFSLDSLSLSLKKYMVNIAVQGKEKNKSVSLILKQRACQGPLSPIRCGQIPRDGILQRSTKPGPDSSNESCCFEVWGGYGHARMIHFYIKKIQSTKQHAWYTWKKIHQWYDGCNKTLRMLTRTGESIGNFS